jgi:hypothetical protein
MSNNIDFLSEFDNARDANVIIYFISQADNNASNETGADSLINVQANEHDTRSLYL